MRILVIWVVCVIAFVGYLLLVGAAIVWTDSAKGAEVTCVL